jgi:hypothetical protein
VTRWRALARGIAVGLALLAAVVAVTWVLEQVMPPPYSGYSALVIVGLVAVQLYKRQPFQRAQRLFRIYLAARAGGASESEARGQLLGRLVAGAELHQATQDVEAAWTGRWEKDRVLGGAGALLARQGVTLEAVTLSAAYNRVRDRFTISGWESLPGEFVDAVLERLDARQRQQLEALTERYRLFQQRFFRNPTSLGADPAASLEDFARLLHSAGNRLTKDEPGDAERAYRLSLCLRPERNLAHAGLALLLKQTGRTREAGEEARKALTVLDEYARHAPDGAATTEDISPFRSAVKLREALERVRTAA